MSTRLKIFIDFWNLQISWNEYHKKMGTQTRPKIPWNKFPDVLSHEVGDNCNYSGTHVYASIDPNRRSDRRLNAFLQIMDTFPGYQVIIKERRPVRPMRCTNPACKKEITHCPHCQSILTRTVEKGVDTTLVTELIQLAVDNVYDKAVIISGDADFVPAIEYIQRRGKYVIHGGFKGEANEIRKSCWSHFFLDNIMGDLI